MRERGKIPYDEKPDYEHLGLPAWLIPHNEGMDLVMVKKVGDKEIVAGTLLQNTSNITVNLETLFQQIQVKENQMQRGVV